MNTLSAVKSPIAAKIDLKAIKHNLGIAKMAAPASQILAAIKANAYGHGLIPVARSLANADAFGVARLEEALRLRNAGINQRIVLLSENLDSEELELCALHHVDLVIHTTHGLNTLLAKNLGSAIHIWLKLDTGMHRLGIPTDNTHESYSKLIACPWVSNVTLMSHFHSADETTNPATEQQAQLFHRSTSSINTATSLANSAALLAWPKTQLNWVRPGIMLYGADPLDQPTALSEKLKPAMELSTDVIAIRKLKAGDSVGYNATWRSNRDTLIATLAIGYADGYPRHAKIGTPVLINNKRLPLVGRTSMDMITVDLGPHTHVKIGDRAILWGDALNVNEIAKYSDTISYDLLTGIGERVKYIYSTTNV